MCGIAGYWHSGSSAESLDALGRTFIEALRHRGPDGDGTFAQPEAGLLLVHTRLAIRDLTPAGAQPMPSADGRYVITYNGEVYGADALRRELEASGRAFRGHSDTEVIVEAVARFGVLAAARRIEGIFAFALWDRRERQLWLARDRVGVKPLYVACGVGGEAVAFASELGALVRVPGLTIEPDPVATQAFFRLGYVPDTHAIFRGVAKVQPGEAWLLSSSDAQPKRFAYHDREKAARPPAGAVIAHPHEARIAVREALMAAVERQLVSDVPVGVFLSGGVDSSLVAAAATRARGTGVQTFSIGFRDPRFDESQAARAVARHLGTQHHELILDPETLLTSLGPALSAFSEPFADSSLLPTWLLCKFAREHVTVALSGDGGDELFGGYNRHLWLPRLDLARRTVPRLVRSGASAVLASVDAETWDRALRRMPVRTPGTKLHKVARLLAARSAKELIDEVASTGPLSSSLLRQPLPVEPSTWLDLGNPSSSLMYRDFVTYLPGDIMTKVDRCSMHVGLEARVPLLDERMVELSARVHPSLKIRGGTTKWILREVLAESVPRALFERPKMGFAIPLADWLRGPLRPWAEELLSTRALTRSPQLDATAVQAAWRALLRGEPLMEFGVWSVLTWQVWRDGLSVDSGFWANRREGTKTSS